jgi:hypothetical protein
MSDVADIEGREFDWYAVDDVGRIAVFATAGSGPVPPLARSSMQAHNDISDSFVVSAWGTPQVWESYSRVGLFAYDWHTTSDCYVRVAVPEQLPSTELARMFREVAGVVRLSVRFSETSKLESTQIMTPNTSFERTREG